VTALSSGATIPAHIENRALLLDAPLPKGVVSVEVRVEVKDPEPERPSVTDFLKSLPPGTRSAKERDDDLREMRADRL
jgi:hypothetical protein